jgi:hypothetical protein
MELVAPNWVNPGPADPFGAGVCVGTARHRQALLPDEHGREGPGFAAGPNPPDTGCPERGISHTIGAWGGRQGEKKIAPGRRGGTQAQQNNPSAVPEAPFGLEKDVQQNVDLFIQVLHASRYCSCLC